MAREGLPFRLRDFHPLRSPFPVTLLAVRLEKAFVTPRGLRSGPHHRPTTPHGQRLRPIAPMRFGLLPVRSPLLGESPRPLLANAPALRQVLVSFPPATGMFPFAGFASTAYVFGGGYRTSTVRWVAPFGNPRIIARSAAPRGLSQLATPFIASGCRGIHRPPLPCLRSRRPIHFSRTGNIRA
ncbi:MAG: Uncharacterized protein XD60_1743 [Acetothermia bacterium 64_32]|nr:MAG: Uncharacterized protein XD60_1743 [Acetothermia bacterium 64_32]